MTSDPRRNRRMHPNLPFRPAIGSDFELEDAVVVDARTRAFVARELAFATSAAIAVTGLQGLITGDTTAISTVWAVTGPIVGALVSYYFGAHRKGFS